MVPVSFSVRCTFALALFAAACMATAQSNVYRYTDPDGRVVYSDKPPPANAKNVQTKRIGANVVSMAATVASVPRSSHTTI